MRKQLKKSVVYSLYALSFILLVGGVSLIAVIGKNSIKPSYEYVSKGILDYEEQVKVVNMSDTISRPYTDETITIVKNYYDYKAQSDSQEQSLIYYEGIYMPSSGISYANGKSFDVVSILPGTITEIKEDVTIGNSITIDHGNGITSIYQSITDIIVKEGDKVYLGQLLAKSSISNISKELDNHLYFELIVDGVSVNAENYYSKTVDEIRG